MKKIISAFIVILVLFALNSEAQQKDFYGMWTLDIDGGTVGWLNVHEDKGFLDAELLWRGGRVVPVAVVIATPPAPPLIAFVPQAPPPVAPLPGVLLEFEAPAVLKVEERTRPPPEPPAFVVVLPPAPPH